MAPAERYAMILGSVPRKIEEVLQCPPVQELVNRGADVKHLEACLALEIARIANMLTVGGNLRQGQSLEIAKTLLSDFPGESLEDFCLCLRNGVKGAYGDIYRFDVLVISEWFKAYLEQKYLAAEAKLMQEKDNQYANVKTTPVQSSLRYKRIEDQPTRFAPVKNKQARALLWQREFYAMSQMRGRYVPGISEKEIKQEGHIKPKRQPYPSTPPGYQAQIDAKVRKGRELYFRENYPGATEEQVKEYLDSFKD